MRLYTSKYFILMALISSQIWKDNGYSAMTDFGRFFWCLFYAGAVQKSWVKPSFNPFLTKFYNNFLWPKITVSTMNIQKTVVLDLWLTGIEKSSAIFFRRAAWRDRKLVRWIKFEPALLLNSFLTKDAMESTIISLILWVITSSSKVSNLRTCTRFQFSIN